MQVAQNPGILPAIAKKVTILFKRYPAILVPFFVVALFDLFALLALFLAPRPPLSSVLAPVIQAFWGERFLHYPVNFLLLPKLFTYLRNATSFVVGVICSGISAALIMQAYQDTAPQVWGGIKKTLKRYFRLVAVWGMIFVIILFASKAMGHFTHSLHSPRLDFVLEFILSIGVQMLFVFAIPAIIIENKKISLSIVRSLALFKNYPLATFALVFIPSLLFIPVTYFHLKLPVLMERIAPEIVLYALIVRIAALAVIDLAVTSSATVLLLMHRERENRGTV